MMKGRFQWEKSRDLFRWDLFIYLFIFIYKYIYIYFIIYIYIYIYTHLHIFMYIYLVYLPVISLGSRDWPAIRPSVPEDQLPLQAGRVRALSGASD